MPATRKRAAKPEASSSKKKVVEQKELSPPPGADEHGNIARRFRCEECQLIREANPKGWISAHCHSCNFAVWFENKCDQTAYLKSSKDWCDVCKCVGHLRTCPSQ